MSFIETQKAIALLIRLPDHNRNEELPVFLNQFDLTENERLQLESLSKHREVLKFGTKMRKGRLKYLYDAIPITLKYVKFSLFTDLIKNEFDMKYTQVRRLELFLGFLNFFSSNKKAQRQLKEVAPDFIFDLIRFELTHSVLEFYGFKEQQPPSTQSLLKEHRFEILSLDYDIGSFISLSKEDSNFDFANNHPYKSPTSYLFIYDDFAHDGYRMFEVTHDIISFVEGQKNNPQQTVELPSFYTDLAEIGLVIETSKISKSSHL